MHNLKSLKKILSFITCAVISAGVFAFIPSSGNISDISALTSAEIQEKRRENDEKIAAIEGMMSSLQSDKESQEQQQSYLTDQISIIQENILLLNAELDKIAEDISETENTITVLDGDIQDRQETIDQNIELFKQRLCSMYVNSNDTSASIVLGSSSFYDMMSRVQLINRIAEYDDKLINDILTDIDELENSKKQMESEKLKLSMKLDEQNKRKEEKAAEIEVLNEKMKETQAEIDRIERDKEAYARDKADLEQENAELEAEQRAIDEAIRKHQEELRQQELLRQQQLQQQQSGIGGGINNAPAAQGPAYVPPAPQASGFMWPAPGFAYISSGFGPRNLGSGYHYGIDVGDAGIHGGAAVASKAGTVVQVNNSCSHNYAKSYSCGCGGGYGNYVVISHDGTYSTLYGHLTSAAVSVGSYVEQGQVIGYMGCTGFSTGSHLHFEVIVNGVKNNPLNYVSP